MWIVAMECVTEFMVCLFFFFQAEDGIRDRTVTGVQTCALPIFAFRQKGYYNEALREYRLALERGEDRRLTLQAMAEVRSEERRVGKEWRARWAREHQKKKMRGEGVRW